MEMKVQEIRQILFFMNFIIFGGVTIGFKETT